MKAAVDFVNQLEILEILAKSLQKSRILLAAGRGAFVLCEFLPRLLCRPRERRPNNFRVVRSTTSESQVSFELKVKRCIEQRFILRAAYTQKFEGQERIKRDRKCVWKPQSSPRTKFRTNAINSNKGYFVLVLQRFFRKGFLCSLSDL